MRRDFRGELEEAGIMDVAARPLRVNMMDIKFDEIIG